MSVQRRVYCDCNLDSNVGNIINWVLGFPADQFRSESDFMSTFILHPKLSPTVKLQGV